MRNTDTTLWRPLSTLASNVVYEYLEQQRGERARRRRGGAGGGASRTCLARRARTGATTETDVLLACTQQRCAQILSSRHRRAAEYSRP